MATDCLPNLLQTKLDRLAKRLHRLRLIRGGSLVATVLAGGAIISVGLDYWFELNSLFRLMFLAIWLIGSAYAIRRWLIRPLMYPLTASHLAAAVEEEYPRLRERLTSSVTLLGNTDEFHGSRAFVSLLIRETDLKTRALDFVRAAPSRIAEWSAAGAVTAVLLLAAPGLLWPETAWGLGRRFLAPWDHRPAYLPFIISVSPGTSFAAKGRPLVVTVELTPKNDTVSLPTFCVLVLEPANEKPMRLRMSPSAKPTIFEFRIDDVKCDYRFRVEAGPGESESFTITAVEPVDLTTGQPTTVLVPPAYAKSIPAQTVQGIADLSVLQHGRLTLDCKFTRPAEGATLIATSSVANAQTERIPLQLAADQMSARVVMPAASSSLIRLEFNAGHGVLTNVPAQALNVILDHPPEFRKVSGLPIKADARATDILPLNLTVADDLGIAGVEIEYKINDGPIQKDAIRLEGVGTPLAAGHFDFKLAGKVNDGDRLQVRLRATDSRDVPQANLGPNVSFFPPGEHWAELHVVPEANSLRQQEMTAKRDEFENRLREIVEQLAQNQRKLYRLHQEIGRRLADSTEQSELLQQVNQAHDALTKKLNDLAHDAATAGYAPLADRAKNVADEELRQTAEALQDANAQNGQARTAPLRRAEATTIRAHDKLEALLQEVREIAKAQIDEAKLREMAARERELAEAAKQAESAQEREQLQEEQKKLAEELDKLGRDNEAVRDALRAARAAQARDLAQKASELAKTERGLDRTLHDAERLHMAEQLSQFANQQQSLADEASRLAAQTRPITEGARQAPLNASDSAKAADSLRQGEANLALQQQEKTAAELDKLADNLRRALNLSRDPKESARQLRDSQEETIQQLRSNTKSSQLIQRDQETLLRSIERLDLPNNNDAARREKSEAVKQSTQALQKLQQNDQRAAINPMNEARQALDRLMKSLPTAEKRQQTAREELSRLPSQQSEITQQVERAIRTGDRDEASARQKSKEEIADAARKQADLADRLNKIDIPNEDARRDRTRLAVTQALDDLLNNRNADLAASQSESRRELERLHEAISGQKPADDRVRELAQQQRQLANDVANSNELQSRQSELQREQDRIARATQEMRLTEAPLRQAEAVQSALQANKALREKPNEDATPQRVREAAEKLEKWADQISGNESNAERAERLARQQQALSQEPRPDSLELRRQTNQIAEELKQVRGGDKAVNEKLKSMDAISRLQRSNPENSGYADEQRDAAAALRQLADKLATDPVDTAEPGETIGQSARELAEKQRNLARQSDAARNQSGAAQRQALDRGLAEQRQLQDLAFKLPVEQAPKAVQQARQAMDRSEQALARNDPRQAAQFQKEAADALEQAARQAQQAKSDADRLPGQQAQGQIVDASSKARELAEQQRALREQVQQATRRSGEPPSDQAVERARQQQQTVAQQSGELSKGLDETSGQMPNEMSKGAAQDAARAAQRAEQSLNKAQDGRPSNSSPARRDAIKALEEAARKADEASRAADPGQYRASPNGQPSASETGQALDKAKGQMNRAQGELARGQDQSAQDSMQQAAQALDQAAERIGNRNADSQRDSDRRAGSPNLPATGATPGRGDPTATDLPGDLQKYAGKKWGELSGELRTRIMQEVKAQYGDDYARIIKLYFEQIADSKPPK